MFIGPRKSSCSSGNGFCARDKADEPWLPLGEGKIAAGGKSPLPFGVFWTHQASNLPRLLNIGAAPGAETEGGSFVGHPQGKNHGITRTFSFGIAVHAKKRHLLELWHDVGAERRGDLLGGQTKSIERVRALEMTPAPPEVSVIIPAHNEELHLPSALKSLESLKQKVSTEVIVVDVGSTDHTSAIAEAFGCEVHRSDRVNPGTARNLAANRASSEVLAFIDGDVLITEAWAVRVKELLQEAEPLSGVFTGAPYGVRSDASWLERIWYGRPADRGDSYINGGNLLVRREDFLALGGFDVSLPTGEDYDLCKRAKREGIKVQIDARLETVHLGYPRSPWEFVIREAWHGSGDFGSISRFVQSKVAIATVVFLVFLLFIPLGISMRSGGLFALGFAGSVATCLAASIYRWRRHGLKQIVASTPVFALYFLGRSFSVLFPESWLARLRSRNR